MKYSLIIAMGLLTVACDSATVYEDFHDLEEAFWPKDSIESFAFQVEDTIRTYNLMATFRNGSSYPYYNIYFQYQLKDSSGQILKKELKELNFFDPKTGEPFGRGLGDLFDHTLILEENYQFNSIGTYSLELQQFMRMDTLPFILSVGARVEFAE